MFLFKQSIIKFKYIIIIIIIIKSLYISDTHKNAWSGIQQI